MSGFKTGYAEKFELLLQLFPFPDREHAVKPEDRKWRNRELEQATEHRLSGPYLSQLRRGKIDDPGMRKLDLLGVVMGFPTELWVLEPEEWDEALLNNTRPGLRVEGLIGPSFPDVLKKKMRGRRHDSRSGALLDNEDPREVAARSKGRLTENAIRAMLDGSLRPNLTQLFALSEVLGVQLDEWLSVYDHAVEDEPEEPPRKPVSIKKHLILKESENLDDDELDVALQFMKQLGELKTRRLGGDSGASGQARIQ